MSAGVLSYVCMYVCPGSCSPQVAVMITYLGEDQVIGTDNKGKVGGVEGGFAYALQCSQQESVFFILHVSKALADSQHEQSNRVCIIQPRCSAICIVGVGDLTSLTHSLLIRSWLRRPSRSTCGQSWPSSSLTRSRLGPG
jgi:hypothetical protein